MRTTRSLLRTGGLVSLLAASGLLWCQTIIAQVTFTITPAVVSNTYPGFINLQITGLTNGEPVKIGKFCDFNGNGAADAEDFRVQAFSLTNNQANVIGGVTNINVPGDWDTNTTSILVPMSFAAASFEQKMVGHYFFRLVSPFNNFAPITVPFTVTNSAFSQSLSGTVVTGGTNAVPYAEVMLFGGAPGDSSPIGGALADSSGNYTLQVPPGTYSLVAFKSNYVADLTAMPVVTLGAGMTASNNLSLLPATTTISGNAWLPAVLVGARNDSGLMAIGFSDTNGLFRLPVTAGQWGVFMETGDASLFGLLGPNSNLPADTTTTNATSVNFTYARGTALFYGKVKDGNNQPLAGVSLSGWQSNGGGAYRATAATDENGKYVLAVTAGTWQARAGEENPGFRNYIFSQSPGDVTFTNDQVVRQDFTGLPATNQISGYLRDGSSNAISGIWVSAQANINGVNYQTGADTDASGHYVINVANGSWSVGVSCGGGDHSLSSDYICPDSQWVAISNNNAVANFTALLPPAHIAGYVRDNNNNPIANVGIYARSSDGPPGNFGGTTDGTGYYSFGVANGTWNVGVNCTGGGGLSQLGFLCVSEQTISVTNGTATANFTTIWAPFQLSGDVKDSNNQPVANIGVHAYATINAVSYDEYAATDASGHYAFSVANGSWHIALNCNNGTGSLSQLGFLCVSEQTTNISSGSGVVNFTVQRAPSQINGYVRDANNNPVTNVGVYAYETNNPNNSINGATDGSGQFVLNVGNGTWGVGVPCGGGPGTLRQLGLLCVSDQIVSVSNSTTTVNFVTVQAPYQISGWVKDTSNHPITNLYGSLSATIGTNFFRQNGFTDASGNFFFQVPSGAWTLNVDCGELSSRGYQCFNDGVTINVLNASVVTNFTVQPMLPLQISTASLPGGTIGVPYSQQLQATGGQPAYSWGFATNSGSLPPGLNLSGDGLLSGTPSSGGTFNFTVQVRDSAFNGHNATQPLSLTINPAGPGGPLLTDATRLADGRFRFSFSTTSGVNYTLQSSSDLSNWTSVLTFSGWGGPMTITDPAAPGNARRFYRLQVGP